VPKGGVEPPPPLPPRAHPCLVDSKIIHIKFELKIFLKVMDLYIEYMWFQIKII